MVYHLTRGMTRYRYGDHAIYVRTQQTDGFKGKVKRKWSKIGSIERQVIDGKYENVVTLTMNDRDLSDLLHYGHSD